MSINLIISVTREQQVAIEEYCINAGLTISNYFTGLHQEFQEKLSGGRPVKYITKEEAKEMFPDKNNNKVEVAFQDPFPMNETIENSKRKKSGK